MARYLDDRLGPDQASLIEDHVQDCGACRALMESLCAGGDDPFPTRAEAGAAGYIDRIKGLEPPTLPDPPGVAGADVETGPRGRTSPDPADLSG